MEQNSNNEEVELKDSSPKESEIEVSETENLQVSEFETEQAAQPEKSKQGSDKLSTQSVDVVDKSDYSLIIDEKCLNVLKKLNKLESGPPSFKKTNLSQPSFLSDEESAIYSRLKAFCLLRERKAEIHSLEVEKQMANIEDKKQAATLASEAYPAFLSPFGSLVTSKKHKVAKGGSTATTSTPSWSTHKKPSARGRPAKATRSPGKQLSVSTFCDILKNAHESTYNALKEYIHQIQIGKSTTSAFINRTDTDDLLEALFPDYKRVIENYTSTDENNISLAAFANTRMKCFDYLKRLYASIGTEETPSSVTLEAPEVYDITGNRADLTSVLERQMHNLTPAIIDELAQFHKDNCEDAKAAKVDDGTQEVVRNQKQINQTLNSIKEVDNYATQMQLPYCPLTNFFLMKVPWIKDGKAKDDAAAKKSEPKG